MGLLLLSYVWLGTYLDASLLLVVFGLSTLIESAAAAGVVVVIITVGY